MKITDEMVERAAQAYAGDEMTHEEWEWVKTQPDVIEPYLTGMRAAPEAALTHPCICREGVACGACMSGATDPATATTTPPAADVREALSIEVLRASDEDKPVWDRGLEEIVDAILAAFEDRPRGTVTDAEVEEEAITRAYNAVTGADDEGWNPDRTLAALKALWDQAREVQP